MRFGMLAFLILIVCVAFYIHNQQPQIWNNWAALISAHDTKLADWENSLKDTPAAPPPQTPATLYGAPGPGLPIRITPETQTFAHSSHILPVDRDAATQDQKTDQALAPAK